MSFLDVTVKTPGYECRAKIEERPELIVATNEGRPGRHFWSDLTMILPDTDLNRLRQPNSDYFDDFVLEHRGERWKVYDPVVYNFNKSPVGNMTVFQINFVKCEYLSDPSRN